MPGLVIPPPPEAACSQRAEAGVTSQTPALPFEGRAVPTGALREAITWFAQTPRGEEAFYVRFCAMPKPLRAALANHWLTDDPWDLFRRICHCYGLRRRP